MGATCHTAPGWCKGKEEVRLWGGKVQWLAFLTLPSLVSFWPGQRWKKHGIFYKSASLRLTRPGTDSGCSMAPNWPFELTSLMVRRNGGLDVHPLSGLRGFKLSCAGHREKLGSLPSMLELASNEDTANGERPPLRFCPLFCWWM